MITCLHCDEAAPKPLYETEDVLKERPFCCEGCITVFRVLHDKGLESYYEIKRDSAILRRRSPVESKKSNFSYLDDEQFISEFASDDTMEFYLEGIHCLACLWLIEKLPEFLPGVRSSKLDLEKSVVTIVLNKGGRFSEAATELSRLGYRPHALKKNQNTTSFKRREERSWLLRIGVAGAAAGNIMLYAVSLYGGASGDYARLFNLISVLFAIPVFTYSAFPFYQNAWNAIKNKTLSIDIPISVSLIVGGIMGLYNLLTDVPDNYFDSLTALVFLLLLSRYFLQKIQEKGLSASDLHYFYQSESVLIQDAGFADGFKEIHPKFIKVNDVLKIRPGEIIPADGVILSGSSHINASLLTGESVPVKVNEGDKILSGTQNLDNELLIRTEKISDETRLGKILKNVENGWNHRSQIVNLTNRISKYFTFTVFLLSGVLFFYVLQEAGLKEAMERSITLLIVTCPCALALAVPLTFTKSLSKASENGIIIKSDEVIEKLSKASTVFIDKTGTITHGKLNVINFKVISSDGINLLDVVYNLEKKSAHPVGIALYEFALSSDRVSYTVTDFKEILGQGVSGFIEGSFYEINRDGVLKDKKLVATFEVEDTVRKDSKDAVKALQNAGLNLRILSGDRKEVAHKIAHQIQLDRLYVHSDLTPENKSELIRTSKNSVMIGDGANDAIALTHADVGIAVMGAMDISLRAADVYLSVPGLDPVVKLMTLSKETMKVIKRNLVLSLLYNSASVVCAFAGVISPLVAAIIMPLSSLTVLISTVVGTRKLRELWKY